MYVYVQNFAGTWRIGSIFSSWVEIEIITIASRRSSMFESICRLNSLEMASVQFLYYTNQMFLGLPNRFNSICLAIL
jgi:hypothetical protein